MQKPQITSYQRETYSRAFLCCRLKRKAVKNITKNIFHWQVNFIQTAVIRISIICVIMPSLSNSVISPEKFKKLAQSGQVWVVWLFQLSWKSVVCELRLFLLRLSPLVVSADSLTLQQVLTFWQLIGLFFRPLCMTHSWV